MALSQLHLEAFSAIAKLGSFTKASESLALTQSALSHRIRNLEDELETALFVRHGTGIRLTEIGARLLQFCRVQSQAEEEFLQELSPSQTKGAVLSGTLRIGGASTLIRSVAIPAIGNLLRENPNVRLELFTRELSDLPRLLTNGQVDFLVICGTIQAPGLQEELLGHEENVLIESAKRSTIENIFLDHDSEDQTTYDFFKFNGKKQTALKRSFMDDIYGLLDGVAEGFGRAVAPLHLISNRRDIRTVKGFKPLRLPVHLYSLKQPYYTKLHQTTLAELRTRIPPRLRSGS